MESNRQRDEWRTHMANHDENKEQANRAYELMFEAAKEWLQDKSGEELAKNAGGIYDPDRQVLILSSLGQELEIHIPEYTCEPILENWHHLILLHYLKNADGTPLTGELTAIRAVKDGMIRGTKFERTANETFIRILKNQTAESILEACKTMGAAGIDGRGDISLCIPFLPNCPMYVNFWLADDEFDANGKMFFDKSVDHYLAIEDVVTVGQIFLDRLERELKA